MARRMVPEGISHDPKDAPCFTHRVYQILSNEIKKKIVCIEDDERSHFPFLRQWNRMEIDIENQWSVNNGTMGLDMAIHVNGKHRMEYAVKLKGADVKLILQAPLGCMGICDERKRILLHFAPLKIQQLAEFYRFKLETDNYVKQNHLSPKGWAVE